jgi:hypothetical protein
MYNQTRSRKVKHDKVDREPTTYEHKTSYNHYGEAFLKYAEEKELDPKSPLTLASFMRFWTED